MSLSKFETDKRNYGISMINEIEEDIKNGTELSPTLASRLFVAYLSRWFISGASHCDNNPIPTPFIMAAETGNMDHARILMMGTDFNINSYGRNGKGYSGYTALLSSIQQGNYDMICFLLQNGANPILPLTGEMNSLNNALHMAIMHYNGDVRIINIVLDHMVFGEGINETISNRAGKRVTPLDMLLNHPTLHSFGTLIGRVIILGGRIAEYHQ